MGKILFKKVVLLSLVLAMAVSMIGCGDQSKDATGDVGTQTEAPKAMTDDEYVAKVQSLYTAIETASLDAMTGVDPTNITALVDATKALATKVKPIYEELGALVAPATYADAQKKISEGVTVSIETLDLSVSLLEISMDTSISDEEKISKSTELQGKVIEFQTKLSDFQSALNEVLANAK